MKCDSAKGGATFNEPDGTFSFQHNQVHVRDKDDIEIASPVEWNEQDGCLVGRHTNSKEVVARVKMVGETLTGEATTPKAIRVFFDNAETFSIDHFQKGK